MKRVLSILLCLVMVFALAACGAQDTKTEAPATTETEAPKVEVTQGGEQETVTGVSTEDETITIAIEGEPPFLMPSTGSAGNPTSYVWNCMIEPLFDYDPTTGGIKGVLADHIEWVDETHYNVILKDGINFANGDPITAEDVAFSLKLSITLGGGSSIWNVDGYKVIDEKTVQLELLNPFVNGAEESLVRQGGKIYSKKVMEEYGYPDAQVLQPDPAKPAASGKYIFKEWVPGQYIMLERNENYWDKENAGYFKYMKFVFVADAAARAMALESGDVDVASYVTTNMGAAYEGSETITPYYIDTCLAGTLILNSGNPERPDSPLKDERVRKAIRLLVDVQAINDLANAGVGVPCETSVSPHTAAYKKIELDRTVNIEEAKRLLAEAGYPDGFELYATNIAPYKAQGEVIKECLRLGGITWAAELEEIPSHFATARTGNYDIAIRSYNHVDYTEALFNNDGRFPPSRYPAMNQYSGDPEWEKICDAVYYTQDPVERQKAFEVAQQYMVDHCISIGLCTTVRLELVRKGLSAPPVNGAGIVLYQDIRPLA